MNARDIFSGIFILMIVYFFVGDVGPKIGPQGANQTTLAVLYQLSAFTTQQTKNLTGANLSPVNSPV